MCWSFSVSTAMVITGAATTVYAARKNQPAAIYLTLGYFTVMEALQAAGYLVVNACGSPANQVLTLLSILHITFQPFFVNAFCMQLIPREVRQRIQFVVYGLCFASAIFMIMQIYPVDWATPCRTGQYLCGTKICLRSGEWHLAWEIPYNDFTIPLDDATGVNWSFPSYILVVFVLPALYGAWRFAVFHALAGPFLATLLTKDPGEIPAIWCFFAIIIILLALIPRLRTWFSVRRWWLWPTSWKADALISRCTVPPSADLKFK
jgi:Family of unknown function (DUF5765)